MRALILNGAAAEDRTLLAVHETIEAVLRERGWQVDAVMLRTLKIAPCIGCFGCWLKTPGVCLINDAGRDTARAIINSDLLVLVTAVTFGGYSPELKKALDRMIPLILPYFMKIKGETHHRPRYERFPDLAAIGVLPGNESESERIFRTLVHRNAINMHSDKYAAEIVTKTQDQAEIGARLRSLFSQFSEMEAA